MLDDALALANFVSWLPLPRSDRRVIAFLLCAEMMGCAMP